MHKKKPFRALLISVAGSASLLLGIWAFALPWEAKFPQGTENCVVFTRGKIENNQNACVRCCGGTQPPDRGNIPECVRQCKQNADLKPGEQPLKLGPDFIPLFRTDGSPMPRYAPDAETKPTTAPPAKPTKPTKKPDPKKKKDSKTGKTLS